MSKGVARPEPVHGRTSAGSLRSASICRSMSKSSDSICLTSYICNKRRGHFGEPREPRENNRMAG